MSCTRQAPYPPHPGSPPGEPRASLPELRRRGRKAPPMSAALGYTPSRPPRRNNYFIENNCLKFSYQQNQMLRPRSSVFLYVFPFFTNKSNPLSVPTNRCQESCSVSWQLSRKYAQTAGTIVALLAITLDFPILLLNTLEAADPSTLIWLSTPADNVVASSSVPRTVCVERKHFLIFVFFMGQA